MDLEKDQRSGGDAAFILNHDIYKNAWTSFEEGLSAQRKAVGIKDTDMHTRLIMAEQVMHIVRKYIENVMNTGKMAELQLRQKPRWKIGNG